MITIDSFRKLPPARRLVVLMQLQNYQRLRNKIDNYYPDEDTVVDGVVAWHAREKYFKHLKFFEAGAKYRERAAMAANRVGKALKHGTRVATPNGWRPIEDLQVGDEVVAGDGSVTRVAGVYPQGEVDLFDLFMDGTHIITTCGDHLWLYLPPASRYPTRHSHQGREPNPRYGQWKVGNTREIAALTTGSPRQRCVVPATKPWQFQDHPLPLHPYLLGVLLGDGSISQGSAAITSADMEVIEACREVMPAGVVLRPQKAYEGKCAQYGFANLKQRGFGANKQPNAVVAALRALELAGCNSSTKFVPGIYRLAGPDSRLELLRGLMDTDGSIHGAGGAMEYSTCSDQLADDFCWLAASLGFKARRERRHTKDQHGKGKPSWRIMLRTGTVCPFRLARKAARWRPLRETGDWIVHSVKPAGRGMATCIEVAHESHTFVIEHGIVTHNTESMGCYELARHLMNDYPAWWPGRKFNHPINAIAAGKTNEAARDILQAKLFGQVIHNPDGTRAVSGTGLIRGDRIGRITWKIGFADLIDRVRVKTNDGRWSELSMKSYEQGRKAFEGTERHVILLDEEPPFEIWSESVIRTATTAGMVIGTFTPLDGITETVKHFLPGEMMAKLHSDDTKDQESAVVDGVVEVAPSRCMIMVGWDDAPHLSAQTKQELLDGTPAYQHKARSKGIPSLGDGAIFPIDEATIKVAPFEIPDHWPRICGLDFGWDHPTAAVWLAWDRENDVIYVYAEYAKSRTVIPLHATAIKSRGKWIPVAWPHDGYQVKDQTNGEQLAQQYRNEDVNMRPLHAQFERTPGSQEKTSVVSVEAGLQEMLTRMMTGRWKVFSTCAQWFEEFRIYRRENGQIIKLFDDVISASRYGMMDLRYAETPPPEQHRQASSTGARRHAWVL